jgi:hypothetical protein
MIAVDTNVLIYACDQADPRRQNIALDLITNAQDGVSCGRSRASSSRPLASLASRDSPRHTRGIASMNSGTFCLLSYPLMAT